MKKEEGMKTVVLSIAALAAGIAPAMAQQQQQADPSFVLCQQISAQKEAQFISKAVEVQTLSKQLEDARAELSKLKADKPNG